MTYGQVLLKLAGVSSIGSVIILTPIILSIIRIWDIFESIRNILILANS